MDVPNDLVTPAEAATIAKVDRQTVYRWIWSGTLPAWRVGRRKVMVSRSDLFRQMQPAKAVMPVSQAVRSQRHKRSMAYLQAAGLV